MSEPSVPVAVQLRRLLAYIAAGVGVFAMVAAWVFVGLKLWGKT